MGKYVKKKKNSLMHEHNIQYIYLREICKGKCIANIIEFTSACACLFVDVEILKHRRE